jgi:flagellar hook-associated protein 1
MSLISALNIGKSALATHQAAIQVTSNNIANAGNPDYTRQVMKLAPSGDVPSSSGVLIGTGVQVASLARQIDDALEERIRLSVSDDQAAGVTQEMLGRVEGVFNALGDGDLSSQLTAFFNSWSNLANQPQNLGSRQVVLQQGQQIAASLQSLRGQLTQIGADAGKQLTQLAGQADQYCSQVAKLNGQIAVAEAGQGGSAAGLRDQRDAVLEQLAQLVDIKVQDTGNGMVNVLVGSEPIVTQNQSNGLVLGSEMVDGVATTVLQTRIDRATLQPTSGQMGALLEITSDPGGVVKQLDTLAGGIIFEVNRLHASGQGLTGLSSAVASNNAADPTAALNASAAGLPFTPQNGTFVVQVKSKNSGLTTSTLVKVDLDGLNGDDTTLSSLAGQLDAIDGISATAGGGRLRISADSGDVEFSFAQDTSGTLAALGINSFFTGKNAAEIAVSAALQSSPALLAAAQNGQSGDNSNARAIAALSDQTVSSLNGQRLTDVWQTMVNGVGVAVAAAKTNQQATQAVSLTLQTQRESLSGVSLDEEAVNLMREQRAYQAAARVISTVDQLMQVLMQIT